MPTKLDPFSGEETFTAPPAQVFAAMTDQATLAGAIPGLASWESQDDTTMRCVVRPGFAFLRSTLRMTIIYAEAVEPHTLVMRIHAQGIGVAMKIECRVQIAEAEPGARVAWRADVHELTGLITAVSPTLIRAAADQVIRDGWKSLHQSI